MNELLLKIKNAGNRDAALKVIEDATRVEVRDALIAAGLKPMDYKTDYEAAKKALLDKYYAASWLDDLDTAPKTTAAATTPVSKYNSAWSAETDEWIDNVSNHFPPLGWILKSVAERVSPAEMNRNVKWTLTLVGTYTTKSILDKPEAGEKERFSVRERLWVMKAGTLTFAALTLWSAISKDDPDSPSGTDESKTPTSRPLY